MPRDGLLRAGEPGIQLTWMDAKHGDHVFTPRIGKPVEINALWLNALEVTGASCRPAARRRGEALLRGAAGARRVELRALLERGGGCLYDVIDVDGGSGTGCRHAAQSAVRRVAALQRAARATDARGGGVPAPASC